MQGPQCRFEPRIGIGSVRYRGSGGSQLDQRANLDSLTAGPERGQAIRCRAASNASIVSFCTAADAMARKPLLFSKLLNADFRLERHQRGRLNPANPA